MKYTEQTYKDIEEIQHLIEEKGLTDWSAAREIMSVSSKKEDDKLTYYKQLAGKYLKGVNPYTKTIEYHYIHPNIGKISTGWADIPGLFVKEDNYYFTGNGKEMKFYADKEHVVSNTFVGRYNDCHEISEEEFNRGMQLINECTKQAEAIYNKLSKNETNN